jgi:thiol:disulfide interchange protein
MARSSNRAFKPLWGLFIILLGVSAVTLISKAVKPKEIVPWRTDLAAARAEATKNAKPLLLYFTATWCGPCQRMKSETWSDASVAARLQNYVPMKIDIDLDPATAQQYRVDGIPTFVLLDRTGKIDKQITGYMDPAQFLAWLEG